MELINALFLPIIYGFFFLFHYFTLLFFRRIVVLYGNDGCGEKKKCDPWVCPSIPLGVPSTAAGVVKKEKLGGKKTYEKDQFLAGVVCARNTRVIPQRERRIKCDYIGTSLFIFICITPASLIPWDSLMFSFQIAKSWNGICYF